jgi:ABC-2 type transport system ATP-binding protein
MSAARLPTPVLVENVVKRYASVTAVDGVSFAVERGEVFALLGPNGAGKSTVVRMLCGIIAPDAGSLRFDLGSGERAVADPLRTGYLPEDRGLYADAKVLPMIVYLAGLRGMERGEAERRARSWLERFDLVGRESDRVDSLSKGNQQKVQLIAALLHEPALAILDEPFSGFDPVNQDLVSRLIRELRDAGTTVLLSAHHMDLVEAIADRVLLLHRGREVMAGSLEQVRASSGVTRRVTVTLAVPVAPEALVEAGLDAVRTRGGGRELEFDLHGERSVGSLLHALTERFEVVDVHSEAPSLRELYLRAVGVDPEGDAEGVAGADTVAVERDRGAS